MGHSLHQGWQMRIDVVSDWSQYYSDFRDSALGLCRVSYSSHCEIDTRFDKDLLAYRTTDAFKQHNSLIHFLLLHATSPIMGSNRF